MNQTTQHLPTTQNDVGLTTSEALRQQETIIERGLTGFAEAGAALIRIKKNKLYKEHYATYKEYCLQRWGFTPQHANQLIAASMTIDRMNSETTVSVLPASERQTRALSKSDNPAKTWMEAQEKTGKEQPTAKEIEEIMAPTDDEEEIRDAEIIEVPVDNTPEPKSNLQLLIEEILQTPFERGIRTGRAQVSVIADDPTIQRLETLKNQLGTAKQDVVAKALLLVEKMLTRFPHIEAHEDKK